jgi:hypothetical protein
MSWNNLKAQHKFWIWIPILLIVGFVLNIDFDLHVKNVIGNFSSVKMAILLSVFLFFSGLGYLIPKLNEYMTKTHLKLTFIGMLISLFFFIWLAVMFNGEESRVLQVAKIESGMDGRLVLGIIAGIIVQSFGALAYILNLITGLFFSQHFK